MRYTEKDIADRLKRRTGINKNVILPLLAALNSVLQEMMADAKPRDAVEIRLCPGLYFDAKYVPKRKMRDPRNGARISVNARCKMNCRFTETFRKAVWALQDNKNDCNGEDKDAEAE